MRYQHKTLVEAFNTNLAEVMQENAGSFTSIAPDVTFMDWVLDLADKGLKVDGQPFNLDRRPAMKILYESIPTTPEEALDDMLVVMKGAQVGATIWEMLANIYIALKFEPCNIGMYLPSQPLAGAKSSNRFMPVLRTIKEAYQKLVTSASEEGKGGEGNVMTRRMGNSFFYFFWTSSKTLTESTPLNVISFDEVQEMLIADVEKTMERLSGSEWLRYVMMLSTAKWPEADIHYWYKLCTQMRFHTKCECENGIILDDHFPTSQSSSVRLPFKEVDGTVEYWCPECETLIEDSQIGEWIPDNPDARYRSIHFPQTLSTTVSAQKVMEKYYAAQDMQNFFNRVLGKPHANPDQIPINMEILRDCERLGIQRGLQWKKSGKGFYMGVDNMGGFSCIVIIERLEDNTMAFVHAEAIYGLNPWARMDELMVAYSIAICVTEHLPNYDSVKTFAARWPGRVYMINSYGDEMLVWKDVTQSKGKKKTETELRDRYAVSINQYKMMDWALGRMVKKKCLFPKVDELTQTVNNKGIERIIPIVRDEVWLHFTKTALVTEKPDDEQHKLRYKVVKVGIDPHFSYAFMAACVAWCRVHGTTQFILPSTGDTKEMAQAKSDMPGLPVDVVHMLQDEPPKGMVCGRCEAYDKHERFCNERDFKVQPSDPGCDFWLRDPDLPADQTD